MKIKSANDKLFIRAMEHCGFKVGYGLGEVYADYASGHGYIIEMKTTPGGGVSHPFAAIRRRGREWTAYLEGICIAFEHRKPEVRA